MHQNQVEEEVRQADVKYFEPKPLTRQRLLQVLWKIAVHRTPPASPRTAAVNTSEASAYLALSQAGASMAINATLSTLPVEDSEQWVARVDTALYAAVEKEFLPRTRERLQRLAAVSASGINFAALEKEAEAIALGAEQFGLVKVHTFLFKFCSTVVFL